MESPAPEQTSEPSGAEKAGGDLFHYVTDREDIKTLMGYLPQEADISRAAVEYELQLLKIVLAGWSVSYIIEESSLKKQILEIYWQEVQGFSWSVSETTRLMTGADIDYFQIVKDRLALYVTAMKENPAAPEPAVVIGPEFAQACGNRADVFTVMTGARMCIAVMGNIKNYFENNAKGNHAR